MAKRYIEVGDEDTVIIIKPDCTYNAEIPELEDTDGKDFLNRSQGGYVGCALVWLLSDDNRVDCLCEAFYESMMSRSN